MTTPQAPGGNAQPGGGGGGAAVAPNVTIPKVPECFGLPIDKDELLQQLEDLRKQVLLNFPLGASPGEAEYDQAKAQQDANLAAIDAAIKQAKDAPYCIVKKHRHAKSGKKTKASHGKHAITEDNPLYMENYQAPSHPSQPASKPGGTSEPPPVPPSEPQNQPSQPDNPYQHGMDIPNQPSAPPN